jgi:hypothetical protein
MRNFKKSFVVLSGVLLLFMVTSYLYSETISTANSKVGVCILNYKTQFKEALTAALVQELNSRNITVTVDTVSNGTQFNPANYGAVILLSAVQAFNPLPKTAEYIISNNYSSNIVYFSTYSMFNLPYGPIDHKKIDAITSASDLKTLEEAKKKIMAKTLEILKIK